jgi:hypothetical protein
MQLFYYGYYLLLVITFLVFLYYKQYDVRLIPLGYLIAVSIIAEGVVEYLIQKKFAYYYVYHFFGPMEYVCICLFFFQYATNYWLRMTIIVSIPVFVIASLILSLGIINIVNYQGLNTSIRGFLLIIIALISLFSLPYERGKSLYLQPVFWVTVAIMLYYGGVFFINGVYNGLLKKYPLEKDYYQRIHNVINIIFNYIYYIFFCVAFVCSKPNRK